MKHCAKCQQLQDDNQFYLRNRMHPEQGRSGYCISCRALYHQERYVASDRKTQTHQEKLAKQRKWASKNRDRRRISLYKSRDQMTHEQAVSAYHCHICDLCGTHISGARKHVDHCHSTNTYRGILCASCNRGLGCFKDNPTLLCRAIKYLARKTRT